jgi:hypothetical protein
MNNDEKLVSQMRIHHIFDKIHVQLQALRIEIEAQKDPITMDFIGQIDIAILKPVHGIREYMATGSFLDYVPMKSPWK